MRWRRRGTCRPPPALPRRRLLGAGVLVVLVLDDVAVNRRLTATVLARAGYALEGAAGGETALMVVEMPGLDRLDATRRLRAMLGAAVKLPFMVVTAHRSEDGEARARPDPPARSRRQGPGWKRRGVPI